MLFDVDADCCLLHGLCVVICSRKFNSVTFLVRPLFEDLLSSFGKSRLSVLRCLKMVFVLRYVFVGSQVSSSF